MMKRQKLPSISSRKKKQSPLRDCSSSSSISIEAPKGCLRFFSSPSKTLNLQKPRFKSAANAKPCSKSSNLPNENAAKSSLRIGEKLNKNPAFLSNRLSVKKPYPKIAFKKMPSTCSKKVPKEMQGNKTVPHMDNVSEETLEVRKETDFCTHPVDRSAFGPMFEREVNKSVKKVATEKPNLKSASGQFSKKDSMKKQANGVELGIDYVENCTPVNKLDKIGTNDTTSSDTNATKTTPPIQASVSPEINCASSSSVLAVSAAKTPACYGAGHIVSGVTDRRKCRARGLLTVGQEDPGFANLNIVENGDDLGDFRKSSVSLSIPFPAEASMLWHLSPCEEIEEDQRTNLSSGHRDCSSSPSTCEVVALKEVGTNTYNHNLESSPFSSGSLGSGNIIRTPQSDSSSDSHVDISWINTSEKKIYSFGYDIDSVTEDLLRASLSPKIKRTFLEPSGFTRANGSSFLCDSMSCDVSPSHLRVSWRDESDVCRCLSDGENGDNKSSSGKKKSRLSPELKADVDDYENCEKEIASLEFSGCASNCGGEREEEFYLKRYNPCEESICTDGDGLAVSRDSDWTSCYKNHSFEL